MHDALAMGTVQRVGDLPCARQRLAKRQRASHQPVCQRLALEPFHHEVRDAVLVADVVQGADVGVIQRGDGARLALEARAPVR